MKIASLQINNGSFKNGRQGSESTPGYFDPQNIGFGNINGHFQNLRLDNDTFSAKLTLSTKERSGFIVKSLKSEIKIDPQGMFFNELDLRTTNSIVRKSFSMTYEDMDDLADFLYKVRMEADLDDSQINSDDISYFAPELKSGKKISALQVKYRHCFRYLRTGINNKCRQQYLSKRGRCVIRVARHQSNFY